MTLLTEHGSRQWIINSMTTAIRKAKRQGRTLSVTDEARRLSQHPTCRMSLDQVKEEILVLAVSERVPMELDSAGDDQASILRRAYV